MGQSQVQSQGSRKGVSHCFLIAVGNWGNFLLEPLTHQLT
jgi:hypothetical protein